MSTSEGEMPVAAAAATPSDASPPPSDVDNDAASSYPQEDTRMEESDIVDKGASQSNDNGRGDLLDEVSDATTPRPAFARASREEDDSEDFSMEQGDDYFEEYEQQVRGQANISLASLAEVSFDDTDYYDDDDEQTTSSFEDDDESFYSSHETSFDSHEEESMQEEEQLRRSSVIAIGIPAPEEEEEEVKPTRFKTPHEVDEEAVSEAIALGIAEAEHDQKLKARRDASRHTMVAREKVATTPSQPFASLPDHDDDDDSLDRKLSPDEKRKASLVRLERVMQTKEEVVSSDFPEKLQQARSESYAAYGTRRNRESLLDSDEEDDDEEEDLEAQAGIPVVVPGAFAMDGMDALPGRQVTGYDSGFDNSDSESEDLEQPDQQQDPEAPPLEVEGEVHQEPQLFDGLALMDDEIPQEETKVPLKVRLLQASIFVAALAAIGVIVGLVVGLVGSRSTSSGDSSDDSSLVGWNVVGEPLTATMLDKDGSYFGSAVFLSADGSRLAVASPGWDESPSRLDVGQVLVYDWNDNTNNWEPFGNELIGPGPRTTTGGSLSLSQTVSLSSDGSRVAFASPDWNGGQVAILQEPNSTEGPWTAVGDNLTGSKEENGRFGYSVAMSSNGTTVAAGAPFEANSSNDESAAGVVRVFSQKSSSWSQIGQDLMGEGSFELNGWSVALSSDGSVLATGSPGGGVVGDFTGAAHAFRLVNGTHWTPLGQIIRGESIRDRFGHCVSLSGDGTVLAVGGWEKPDANTGGLFVGHVRIYKYEEETKEWKQLGSDLVGSEPYDDFGYSVSLSSDGNTVTVGSPRTNSIAGGIPPRGRIEVFWFDGSQWQKQGGSITSTQDFENLGHSVSISGDLTRVAGGAPAAGFDGKYNNVGRVVVVEPMDG